MVEGFLGQKTISTWFPEGYRALLERGESEEERKERKGLEDEINALAYKWNQA